VVLLTTVTVKGRLAEFEGDIGKFVDKKCTYCSHLNVCAVYRAVKPLLGNWNDKDRPFEAESLAKICREFTLAVKHKEENQ
jgi:hypothetical protein